MTGSPLDCLCAGIIVADHVCDPVDHLPAPGELVLSDRMRLTVGGCAANVACDLATLGRKAGVAGRVGHDVFGRSVLDLLKSAGVNCDLVSRSETAGTSSTFVINTRGEDRRFIHAIGANGEFRAEEVTAEKLSLCRILYVGGYCLCDSLAPDRLAEVFQTARKLGVTTVLDVVIPQAGDYWPQLLPVLPWTDYFLPNADEAQLITGLADPVEQAIRFRQAGVQTAVITCGPQGAVLLSETDRIRCGSFPVEFVDGTGSGDAFVAGFLHGRLSGSPIEHCLKMGSALGAHCVQAAGATTGIPTALALQQFLAENPLRIEPF